MTDEPENIVLQHLTIRARLDAVDARLEDSSDGQTVLTNLVMQVLRDLEHVKRLLGRMEARIEHLEKAAP
jgi:hypothetical protein